ncbi:MAG: hypothetical protein ACK50Q_12170 [Labrys sp. (in: a-proteobacteria)]|jgi:hypothetical protein
MKTHHLIIAVGAALFALTGVALSGFGKLPATEVSMKGDRLDVIEQAQRCVGSSMMAACADDAATERAIARNSATIQVYSAPGETIIVRTKVGI